jgi:hypothetical protein
MKLPWGLCPYCGTPEPGKRREDISVTEAVKSLDLEDDEEQELDPDRSLEQSLDTDLSPEDIGNELDLDLDLDDL